MRYEGYLDNGMSVEYREIHTSMHVNDLTVSDNVLDIAPSSQTVSDIDIIISLRTPEHLVFNQSTSRSILLTSSTSFHAPLS